MVRILLPIIALFLFACGERYTMTNTLPEEVDVTEWVTNKGYKPEYIDGRIDRLINPNPPEINQKDKVDLSFMAYTWFALNVHKVDSLHMENIEYKYSYIISYEPVDVYCARVLTKDTAITLYFRKGDGKIITPINSEGWVIRSEEEDTITPPPASHSKHY